MKRLLTMLVAAVIGFAGMEAEAANIRGKIVDATDKSPLPEATVRLVKATKDSTYVAGAAADAEGRFTHSGVRQGKNMCSR